MKQFSNEQLESVCTICGDPIGSIYNHELCSKEKQRLASFEKSKAPKKLNKKNADFMAGRYR